MKLALSRAIPRALDENLTALSYSEWWAPVEIYLRRTVSLLQATTLGLPTRIFSML